MSEFRFFHPIEVRYGDLDPQGHLNNAKYLTYFETARINYFIQLGLFKPRQSFMDIGVIMAEARVTFHAPVQYGTSVQVGVRTSKLGNKSMTVEQNIVNAETGEVLASGQVILVAFDYHANKTLPIPKEMREAISNFEGL
ncbi:MAG: acyl-CoA thioesterase [Anaerolineales bacterium]|nr:acyl-CoA thioesterase [Anaerolineales bacterium]